MSMQLADQQLKRMEDESNTKSPVWKRTYMDALLNPFSKAMKNLKLLDGEIKHTAGMDLRATGEILCNLNGPTNIIIFPGLTNVLCYSSNPTGDGDLADFTTINLDSTIFKQHLSTASDRANVPLARIVAVGARFLLTNSAEEDDGYWEAARITTHIPGDVLFKNDSTNTYLGAVVKKALNTDYDLVMSDSYQYGNLRDMNKMVFKLNSTDNDHKFSAVSGLNANDATSASALTDIGQWDMIFIKIRGRRGVGSTPSVLRFDTICHQELVYAENSPLARLMSDSPGIPDIERFLEHSRVTLPAYIA
ncbi:hypothetical protein ACA910_017230 [Epithemia clementina (nom. ined.)]